MCIRNYNVAGPSELIAGCLKQQSQRSTVCHESLDQYIYCVATQLIAYLPRRHQKRRTKRPYRKTGERIPNTTNLGLRPLAATNRREYGHWETDLLVVGDRQHGLNVLVEQKSRLTHLSLLANKTAVATKQVMLRGLQAYPDSLCHSITYDNGRENVLHEEVNAVLGTQSFFCAL